MTNNWSYSRAIETLKSSHASSKAFPPTDTTSKSGRGMKKKSMDVASYYPYVESNRFWDRYYQFRNAELYEVVEQGISNFLYEENSLPRRKIKK